MKRLFVFLAVAVLAGSFSARADDINTALQRFDQATQDAIDARRQQDYANANQRDAAIRAHSAISDLQTLRTILDEPSAVQQAQNDALAAIKVFNEENAKLMEARARLDAAAGAVDKYRAAARASFESSPAFGQVSQQLQSAQAEVDAASLWSAFLLDQDAQFQELAGAVQFAQARVQWLRDNAANRSDDLAAASRAWINAIDLANNYAQWWFANDTSLADARAQLSIAQRDRDALNARFESDLAADPDLIPLVNNRDVEQKAVESLNEDVRLATEARKAADERARLMQERYNQAVVQLANVQQELMAARIELDQTIVVLDNADRRARWAQDAQDRAAIERDQIWRGRQVADDLVRQQRFVRERDIRDRDNRDRAAADRDRDRQQRQENFDRDRNSSQSRPEPVIHPTQAGATPPPRNPAPVASPRTDQQQQQRSAQADADRRQRDDNASARTRDDDTRSSRNPDSSSSSRTRDPDPNDRGSRYQR